MLLSTATLCWLTAGASALGPRPDEGWDFLLLEMPHRTVMGGPLQFAVRGRPGVPYVVFGAGARARYPYQNLTVHLGLGSLFVAGSGVLPPAGASAHALPIPNVPGLDGSRLFFQGFGQDSSAIGGLTATDSKAVTLLRERGQPLVPLLTVNRIPRDQNGSEPLEGRLAVPLTGFSIDLVFDDRGGMPIDPTSLSITADQPLGLGQIAAGAELAGRFQVTGAGATAVVDASWSFPVGRVTLTASVANRAGTRSPVETYRVRAMALTSANRPFASRQLWWVDFDAHDLDGSGVADYREDLLLFGLGNSATAVTGPAATVATWCRDATLAYLRAYYGAGSTDPVDVAFFDSRPATTHARICVGGRNGWPASQLPPGAQETTGSAFLNPRNQRKNFVNCGGNLGVHPRSIFHLFNGVAEFMRVFDPLIANPVGNDPLDAVVTAPSFDPGQATAAERQRHQQIVTGVLHMSRAVAFVLTQETSHSMGLVANGSLGGAGLLGAERWGHSTGGHFDDGRGNFMSGNNSTPAPAAVNNLALIWSHFQSGRAHFTPLNWAYLRERVIQG